LRCTSTGRVCDGYDLSFRPKSNTPASNTHGCPPPSSEHVRSHSPVVPVPLAPALRLDTAQERDSFEFFSTYAVSSLRGFVDSPFWEREIFQAAHQHEPIKHCIIALGAMHRRFYEGISTHLAAADLTDNLLQFAFRQSNQAIRGLIKASVSGHDQITGVDKITLMTCSILFNSMACLQGHQLEGLQHLRSGLRMLNEMDHNGIDRLEPHAIELESLRTIFVGLDMQARSIMSAKDSSDWEPMPQAKWSTILPNADLDDRSLFGLQGYFHGLFTHVLGYTQATRKQPTEERNTTDPQYCRLRARLDQGISLLDKLFERSTSDSDTQPLMALRLLHTQTEFMLQCPHHDSLPTFGIMEDTPGKPFDAAAHCAKLLDHAVVLLGNSPLQSPVFTSASGPLAALWMVATRAPSYCMALRKRAARLMITCARREGFWDGHLGGQVAFELLRLEQESVQSELGLSTVPGRDLVVPDDLRIMGVSFSNDDNDNRRAKVEYWNSRNVAEGSPGHVQWLHW
jgi:hypothetical protein